MLIPVKGSSAGSVPTPVYAVELAQLYPNARIAQLGDASGAYRDLIPDLHTIWNTKKALAKLTSLQSVSSQDMDFFQFYWGAKNVSSAIQYASYDTTEDTTLTGFIKLTHEPVDKIQSLLEANLKDIEQRVKGFRYFVAGGGLHTILALPQMYTYKVGNITFIDWLVSLAAGQSINNVHCDPCEIAEEIN